MAESMAGWARIRQLNITRLLSLVRVAPSTEKQGDDGVFRITHTPDRPDYPAPAAAAPTDAECIAFLEAFRSPKRYGWGGEEETEEEPNQVTGANMGEWRPYPPLKDFPRSPQTAGMKGTQAEQTMLVTTMEENQQQLHARTHDERCRNVNTEQRDESIREHQVGVVTKFEDAHTRLQMLASHRRAARWSDQSQDSGYEEVPWCRGSHDAGPKVTIPTHPPQNLQSTTESRSRWSSSTYSQKEHWSPLEMQCQQADENGDGDNNNNDDINIDNLPEEERPDKGGHIAHVLPTSEHDNMTPHSSSSPVLAPSDTPRAQQEPTQPLPADPRHEKRRITSRFQDWQTPEQREEFERNVEVYGDWAEYYFQAKNFEDSRQEEKRKQRGSSGDTCLPDSHTARSLETVWEDPRDAVDNPWPMETETKPWAAERGIHRGYYLGNDGLDGVRVHQEKCRPRSGWKPPPRVRPLRSDVYCDVARYAILNKPLPVNPGLGGMI